RPTQAPTLCPSTTLFRSGKLYGRGAADDGYAVFSSVAAIVALKAQRVKLPRCLVLIEASEESGSIHLPAHLDALGAELAEPSLRSEEHTSELQSRENLVC